jgi:hypothetical protein
VAKVWYATLEEVKVALNSKETARNNAQLVRLIEAATDSIECDQLHRRFYPEVDTRTFDWPTRVESDGSRTLALGINELVSQTGVEVGGDAVDPAHLTLLPVDGPPHNGIELDSTVDIGVGASVRRAVEVSGTFGYWAREAAAGTLAGAVADESTTSVTVSDSSAIGTGQLLLVGAERMIVDRRSMVDTGQDLAADLDKATNAEVVQVGSGAAFAEGEVVMVDAEKMLVVEIAGNQLIVKRGWDGSTLAAHTTGADVFAPRKLTVRRGVLGTTAAAHADGAAVSKHLVPKLVNQLCIAETLTAFMQENSGYGRTIGAGESEREGAGAGLPDLRERAWQAYGRKAW